MKNVLSILGLVGVVMAASLAITTTAANAGWFTSDPPAPPKKQPRPQRVKPPPPPKSLQTIMNMVEQSPDIDFATVCSGSPPNGLLISLSPKCTNPSGYGSFSNTTSYSDPDNGIFSTAQVFMSSDGSKMPVCVLETGSQGFAAGMHVRYRQKQSPLYPIAIDKCMAASGGRTDVQPSMVLVISVD